MQLDRFWCCDSLVDVDESRRTWPLPEGEHKFNYLNSCGLRYEADAVRMHIRAGLLESDTVSHEASVSFARIAEEIRMQIGGPIK